MNKQYTNEDVQRLVNEASDILAKMQANQIVGATVSGAPSGLSRAKTMLRDALAPFLPDPEEELIEAMAQADAQVWNTDWSACSKETREKWKDGARASLAIVKERGLPQ